MSRREPVLPILLVAIALSGISHAQPCLRVETPGPITLPDGTVQPAGTLRICYDRPFSPSWSLHEISVDETRLGLFRARSVSSEQPSNAPPYVVFRRTDDERLILVGYGSPGYEAAKAYRLEPVPVVRVQTRAENGEDRVRDLAGADDETRLVLIARKD